MKHIQIILLAALLTCFSSCDAPQKLLCNGKECYIINTECGTISVRNQWFGVAYISFDFNGEYKVLLDSIKITGTLHDDYREHVSYEINTKDDKGYKQIDIPNDTVLFTSNGISLRINPKNIPREDLISHVFQIEDKCLLLQKAIYCNGEAVPIDTIKLEGLFSRDKRKKR